MTLLETKDKKGISLLALVITILVVLIISGATISIILFNSGLIEEPGFITPKQDEQINNRQ